jgi:hypothetical protein
MGLTDQESSCRAIERLIANYAELVDDGEFAVVGRLLADATFSGGAGTANGSDAIEKMLRDNVIVYDDAHPNQARHDQSRHGSRLSGGVPYLALQPIVSGRYHDRFERRDGQWRFVERRVGTDLVGGVSHHLRRPTAEP